MTKARELADLIANVNNGSSLANKNFIINGAMNVAQRGTSSTGLGAANGYFTTDRMRMAIDATSAGRYTMAQTADSPLSDSKKAEWKTYRQTLRDLPSKVTPKFLSNSPRIDESAFPTKPS